MMQFLQSYGPLLAVVAAIIVASLIAKFSTKQNEESLGQFGVGFTNSPVTGENFKMISLPEPQKKEEPRKGLIGSLLAAAAAPAVKPKRRQKKSTAYDNRRSGKEELQARRKRQRQARRRARALAH